MHSVMACRRVRDYWQWTKMGIKQFPHLTGTTWHYFSLDARSANFALSAR